MADELKIAEDRADELAQEHNLTKARRDGAVLALTDAHARGEWPPPPSIVVEENTPAPVDGAAIAARVVQGLRSAHIEVTGPMHKVIARAVAG